MGVPPPCIVPIVEGHAEVEGVPVLLRRLLAVLSSPSIGVARPFRVKRTRIRSVGEVERAIELAVHDREGAAAVLITLDADDDCPVGLAAELKSRALSATNLPVSVVVAIREFEAWFLGAKESLRGMRGIRDGALSVPDAEEIRGAKERLSGNMEGRRYLEVDDQPALAAHFDVETARSHCPSFDKLWREVERLTQAIQGG